MAKPNFDLAVVHINALLRLGREDDCGLKTNPALKVGLIGAKAAVNPKKEP